VKARVRKALLHRRAHAQKARRVGRLGQHAQAFAAVLRVRVDQRLERGIELVVGLGRALVRGRAGAVGVVEIEHGSLREQIRRTEARRMIRVALDLGRPPLVRLHEQAERLAAAVEHGGVVQRHTRRHVLGSVRIRKNLLDRPTDAALDAGERRDRAAQRQKLPPLERAELDQAHRPLDDVGAMRVFLVALRLGLLFQAAPQDATGLAVVRS
jgi:hypothetical protein